MRYDEKLNLGMSFLLLYALAALPGCSGDASQTVQPGNPVAVVSVALDSTTLLVGHSARASATAKDIAGNSVSAQGISWKSLDSTVATVSSSGEIAAVGSGSTVIQGTLSGKSGVAPLTVPLASHNFDDGTIGAYTYAYPLADLDFPADPTGSGRGKVARFHYVRADPAAAADVNRSITYVHKVGWGETIYFKGDVYFPISSWDAPVTNMGRKLLYWQQHAISGKYGKNRTYFMVLTMAGHGLQMWNGNEDRTLDFPVIFNPSPNTWYTIEVRLTNQSAPGVADGVMTVWINGTQAYTNTALAWVPSSWIGVPVPGGNGTPLDAADLYFEHFQIGDQVNSLSLYDEYRYWDNVSFSTQRIGK